MTTQTNTNTTHTTDTNTGYETSTFALTLGIAMAAMIGIWGAACLVSALMSNGPVSLATAYFGALLG